MAIRIALRDNALTADPNDHLAQVQFTHTATLDELIADVTAAGSPFAPQDIRAAVEGVFAAAERRLLSGERVSLTGFCDLYTSVSGVFTGPDDHFDPVRHRVDTQATPSASLRERVRRDARVEKVEATRPTPDPLAYDDAASHERNHTATPANIGTLVGNRLKVDPTKPDEGIFFVAVAGGAPIKVVTLTENKPKRLIFLLPALAPGLYWLEVRARVNHSNELRTGRLDQALTV